MAEPTVPTARDVMVRSVVHFSPDTLLLDALRVLVSRQISGGPVLDAEGRLVGILSEKDCLKLVAGGAFHEAPEGRRVADYMTTDVRTIPPDTDVFTIAGLFLAHPFRRLPVIESERLVGQVSRRDALAAIDRMQQQIARARGRHYPDYREPA